MPSPRSVFHLKSQFAADRFDFAILGEDGRGDASEVFVAGDLDETPIKQSAEFLMLMAVIDEDGHLAFIFAAQTAKSANRDDFGRCRLLSYVRRFLSCSAGVLMNG